MFCIWSTRLTLEPSVLCSIFRIQAPNDYAYKTRLLRSLAGNDQRETSRNRKSKRRERSWLWLSAILPSHPFHYNKAFSFRHNYSSLPGLASTPGVRLLLPWQAQKLVQGTVQLCPRLYKGSSSKFFPITLFECSTYARHYWTLGGTWPWHMH